jgi:outer membrane protein assembly factor BamB
VETAAHVTASPVLATDGTIYIGSWDKHLHALRNETKLASAPWPKFRGPIENRPGLAAMPASPPAPVVTTSPVLPASA